MSARVSIEAPKRIRAPLSTWDVGLLAGGNPTAEEVPPPSTISAQFAVPANDTAAEQVTVHIAAPGVATPTTATTAERVAPGDVLTCSWRYAAPVPSRPKPYDLPITVTATYTSNGTPETVSQTATIRVPAPDAPTTTVYLSDCEFSFTSNGFGPVARDRANGELASDDGQGISLGGTTYAKGLGVHAASQVSVNLGGRCDRFTAVVGIDAAVGSSGSVRFVVRGDDAELFSSGRLTGGSTAQVDVDVSGVQRLDLLVDNGGDDQASDHADWADARIVVDG